MQVAREEREGEGAVREAWSGSVMRERGHNALKTPDPQNPKNKKLFRWHVLEIKWHEKNATLEGVDGQWKNPGVALKREGDRHPEPRNHTHTQAPNFELKLTPQNPTQMAR